jgi:hypothetical protein
MNGNLIASASGWLAPSATLIAAMITAANFGARPTGWGFAIFAVGSISWVVVGASTGQNSLLITNAVLTIVKWRWLGRLAAYEAGGRSASVASRYATVPTLFTATGIAGRPVYNIEGEQFGTAIEALVECDGNAIRYVVISTGGLGGVAEELRAVDRSDLRFESERLVLKLDHATFTRLAVLKGNVWPERTDPAHVLLQAEIPNAAG